MLTILSFLLAAVPGLESPAAAPSGSGPHAFEIRILMGWSTPWGHAVGGDDIFDAEPLDQHVSPGPRIGASLAYFPTRHVGFVAQAGVASLSSRHYSGSASSWDAGIGIRLRFPVGRRGRPWAGVGLCYERLSRTSDRQETQADVLSWQGDALSNVGSLDVAAGWSWQVGRHVALGPVIDATFGQFNTHTRNDGNIYGAMSTTTEKVRSRAWHRWIMIGADVAFSF